MTQLRIEARVLTITALGAVFAATAHTSVWSPIRSGVVGAGPLILTLVASFAAAAGVVSIATALMRSRLRLGLWTTLPAVVVLGAVISLEGITRLELGAEPELAGVSADEPTRLGRPLLSDWRGPAIRRDREEEVVIVGPVVASYRTIRFIAILAAIALAGLILGSRSRRAGAEGVADGAPEVGRSAAHGAVVASIDEMLADADPRTAIIGAYRRLLDELGGLGAGRLGYEGPNEHLARVLSDLSVRPESVTRLVSLFEEARYSEHELTTTHRSQAIEALREVARELVGPTDVRSPSGVPA